MNNSPPKLGDQESLVASFSSSSLRFREPSAAAGETNAYNWLRCVNQRAKSYQTATFGSPSVNHTTTIRGRDSPGIAPDPFNGHYGSSLLKADPVQG